MEKYFEWVGVFGDWVGVNALFDNVHCRTIQMKVTKYYQKPQRKLSLKLSAQLRIERLRIKDGRKFLTY